MLWLWIWVYTHMPPRSKNWMLLWISQMVLLVHIDSQSITEVYDTIINSILTFGLFILYRYIWKVSSSRTISRTNVYRCKKSRLHAFWYVFVAFVFYCLSDIWLIDVPSIARSRDLERFIWLFETRLSRWPAITRYLNFYELTKRKQYIMNVIPCTYRFLSNHIILDFELHPMTMHLKYFTKPDVARMEYTLLNIATIRLLLHNWIWTGLSTLA